MTVDELVSLGASRLPIREGLRDPRREARWLLGRLLARHESWVMAHGDEQVASELVEQFLGWTAQRAAGQSAHSIAEAVPFWGRELEVSGAVLVPRPETELVIEQALGLPLASSPRVLDVGTGAGPLAVTLALELPNARVLGTDVSLDALTVARRNARQYGAAVALCCADLTASLAASFDLVVGNLPYVPSDTIDNLIPEVKDFEPRVALDGGGDGTDLLRRFLNQLPGLLAPGGFAILELGPEQASPLVLAAAALGIHEVSRVLDAGGAERVLVLTRK